MTPEEYRQRVEQRLMHLLQVIEQRAEDEYEVPIGNVKDTLLALWHGTDDEFVAAVNILLG